MPPNSPIACLSAEALGPISIDYTGALVLPVQYCAHQTFQQLNVYLTSIAYNNILIHFILINLIKFDKLYKTQQISC